jgi:hypothetical protein
MSSGLNPTLLPSGTYYITSQVTETVFTLANGAQGNLTAWALVGDVNQQVCYLNQLKWGVYQPRKKMQWIVSTNGATYTFQSVAYGSYISLLNRNLYDSMYGDSTPYPWVVQSYKGGYMHVSAFPNSFVSHTTYRIGSASVSTRA